jgi:hypothetical protein
MNDDLRECLPEYTGDPDLDDLIEAAFCAGCRATIGVDNMRRLDDLGVAADRLLTRLRPAPIRAKEYAV